MDFNEYVNSTLPFESEIGRYFNQHEPITIFDIGACEGEDSIRLQKRFPNATVYSFEPLPENVKKIRKNFQNYGMSKNNLYQLALSSSNGTAEFHVSSGHPDFLPKTEGWDYGNKSSSLLPPKDVQKHHPWLKFAKKIKVKTQRTDEFCEDQGITNIDFVFMDVQGAELMVLQGTGDLLKSIKVIWMEVEALELYANQPLQNDVESFMRKHGFRCIKSTVDSESGDQLYVNKRLLRPTPKKLIKKGLRVGKATAKRATSRLTTLRSTSDVAPLATATDDEYRKVSYSQSGEDLIIQFIFQALQIDCPTYVDIGAHHPRYINNTAIFYDAGSRGINIEPDPELFGRFQAERQLDTNLNIGISANSGTLDFYVMSVPGLNTFSKKEALEYEKMGYKINKVIPIRTKNINDVLKTHLGKAPDLITIDVEGMDLEVLKSIEFSKFAPVVFCIETISFSENGRGKKDTQIASYLKKLGYMVYADTHINTIFVKENRWVR